MRWFKAAAVGTRSRTRNTRRWTGRIAAVVGFALLPGLIAAPGFTASPTPLGRPKLSAPRVDKVTPFTPRLDKKASQQVAQGDKAARADAARARAEQNRTVTWPKTGTASLTPGQGLTATGTPGSLPVTVGAPHAAKHGKPAQTASSLAIRVLDQKSAKAAGVKGVLLTATGPTAGGAAQLTMDYSQFASAYGGDWAGRLRLVRLPACALTTPGKPQCRTQQPFDSVNDRTKQSVSAQLSLPKATGTAVSAAAPLVLALAAGTQSSAGDYKATPLSSSSTWDAGGGSGAFTWSYPLRMPPAAAGPTPSLSISYDSGSIDGRTGNTNNQGSWIGEGFDITSSYIERSYGSCDDDGQDGKYDLCWKYDNASLVLNGKATELVKDDTTGEWRLKDDDASKVIHSTGADNGDDGDATSDGKGEYWTVITGDGTKYVFGLNKLPGAGATDRTDSVWTVPVFGDDAGEPGYSSGTSFSGRDKKQAWRWNLDYVVDTHDNAMTYWYAAEHNNYAKNGIDTPGTDYVRGGYLKEIRYGQRADALFSATPAASDKVVFTPAERCLASGTGCNNLDDTHRDNWPDVPFDAICDNGDACTGNDGPSFFTRKRLTAITTQFWDTTLATPDYTAVDTWSLKQLYLDPGDTGDSSDQSLWLDQIQHTGKRGTDLALDPVKFTHTWLPNRVDATDGILPLNKPRLKTITSETGAQTIVDYADQDCVAGQTMPKPDTNTRRCYPVYWSPNGAADPQLDWFNKYPVTGVRTSDPTGGSQATANSYSYSGGGAWHYNDDPMTPEKERTWSIWRGYEKVTHLTGEPTGTQSKTVTVFLRGMDGDRVLGPDGKSLDPDKRKSVTVTGIKASALTDSDQYAGFVRESVTYNGADEVSGNIGDPWSQRTATQHKSYADTEAYFVRTGASHARTNITSGATPTDRVRTTVTTYDDHGMAIKVEDKGDDSRTGDETCSRTWYARNDAAGITSLVARTRVVARNCGIADADLNLPADSKTAGDVISDTATAYDTTTWSETQTPTKGEARWTGRANGYTTADAPTWQKLATTTYDALGRPLVVKDTNDLTKATTSYAPAASGPLTSTTTSDANTFATTTTVDPASGAPLTVTDPNSKVTEYQYDSLGRVSKVWLPNYLRVLNKPPTYTYTYSVSANAPSWVATGTLKADGATYNTTYEIYDALLRSRQVQTPSPVGGRIIAETLYDERGLAATSGSDIYDNTAAPSGTLVATDGGQAPVSTQTTYDGAARSTKVVTKNYSTTRWTTTSTYTGDTVTTTAPTGGQATATVTNALGQTTQSRTYDAPTPTGAHYTTTNFTYTPAGQQKTITGPDSTWSYTYDLFGRQVEATDPDKGKSTTGYNELDQAISTNDAENHSLLYEYDKLGRKTKQWSGSKTDANLLAAWNYDTAAKGQLDSATRYDGSLANAYTKKVTTYDSLYRPTATQLVLPTSDPLFTAGVPSTLAFSTTYNLDGTVQSTKEPAVAGLALETISNTYNDLGLQLTAKGTTGYLQRADYSPLGDLRQLTLAKAPTDNQLYITNTYEPSTRRLTQSLATDDTHAYQLQNLNYKQDDAGNVTHIFDTTTLGGTGKTDNQCFTYDGYRRLTEAWTPNSADCTPAPTTAALGGAAPYWNSYTYKDSGLRDTSTVHTAAGNTTTTYGYGTPNGQPHALSKTTVGTTTTGSYGYNKTGNTTTRPGTQATQTLTWNPEGKLATSSEPAAGSKPATGTKYLYDADGTLLIRRPTTTDGETVLYLGATEVHLKVTGSGATKALTGSRYYSAAGQTIAVRTSSTKVTFLAGDSHGTSSLAFEAGTSAISRRYTTPFGADRGAPLYGPWPDDKGFLGETRDTTTGLTHIGAREYDPGTGRFISVDPVLDATDPQSLNGYSYADNNPVTYSDPTGLWLDDGTGHSEPNPKDHSGNHRNNVGVPRGGTGTSGCYYTCGAILDDQSTAAYYATVASAEQGLPYVRNAQTVSRDEFHRAMVKYQGIQDGAVQDSQWMMWLYGYDEEVIDNFGPCMIFDCQHGVTSDDIRSMPLNNESFMEQFGRAYAEGRASRLGLEGKGVARAGGCLNHSFVAGTEVQLADGDTEPIEDIKIGDKVTATDPQTGKTSTHDVINTIVTKHDEHFVKVAVAAPDVDDSEGSLTATTTHPFWSPSTGGWVDGADLRAGMTLRTPDGHTVEIVAVSHFTKRQTTYDLTISGVHTYYVLAGATPVLVHNSSCPVPISKGRWDHIWDRHVNRSQYPNKSKFNTTSKAKIEKMINRALGDETDDGVYFYRFPSSIGTTAAGDPQYYIRVVVRDRKLITAFPSDAP
ncbi:RHS repeat-associated core domain-containing protein [Streptomyces sp. NPDC048231]|uniref:RHS repeat-associated core domain-containing protein n=1 Tax=Streptomyces sp. NPDC048231 TaxID=3365519 RepID=UPI00371A22A6